MNAVSPIAPAPVDTQLTAAAKMRAIVQPAYGGPEVLVFAEVDRPVLTDDGVLIRVRGASTNKGDWHLLTGTPYLVRVAGFGLLRPNVPVAGMAIAGRVEAVGPKVTRFTVGDEVYAEISRGGFAEYAVAPESALALKPPALSFEEAAAFPIAATTALQGLRDAGRLQAGQSVLVIGASSGVGTFAVQIAKAMGATVTGVCSGRNVELVRGLGADRVINYEAEDLTASDERFDVVFDIVGSHPLPAVRRVMADGGRFVACAGGAEHTIVGPLFSILGGLLSNLTSSKPFVPLAATPNAADLVALSELVEAGKVRPVIDRRFTLAEVPEALRYQGTGRTRGKNVISV